MKKLNTLTIIIGLSASSILLICLIAYVERSTISSYERNKPYLVMGEYLKNLSTKAHLWFEEAMAGDNTVNVEEDVYGLLVKCTETLKGAQAGALTPLGNFYKSDDAETIAVLNESVMDVENLISAARKRWEFKLKKDVAVNDSIQVETGEQAGGLLDQEFDASYEELQTTFERLVAHVNKNAEADSSFLNLLSWLSIALIALTLSAFCIFIYKILTGNDTLTKEVNRQLTEEGLRVNTLTGFLEKVSAGVYDMELESTSELNNKLLTVRNKLRDSAQEEKQRTWSTTGLAHIGELLRANYKTSTELYDQALRFIIKYTNSNQGGLFLVNDDNKNDIHLSLMACYAFERTKYMTKRIDIGEGMVGQCFVEREPIYMTEIPQEYVRITSGLGGANPSALLIMPLQVNEEIVGVLELASFKNFEAHEMELVKKFAESIASTVSTVRVNEKTKYLLEQSQQQAEEMRAQEEEMRQNMEELTATQEEMNRKDVEISGQITAINNTMATIEFNVDGTIRTANEKFLKTMGYAEEEVKGKHHRMFVDVDHAKSDEYNQFWKNLSNGLSQSGEFSRKGKNGKVIWLSASYTPILNKSGVPFKIIKFAQNITEAKVKTLDFEGQVNAIRKSNAVIEFDTQGKILEANEIFVESMGYRNKDQIVGKHHSIFITEEDQQSDDYKKFWQRIANGEFFTGEFKRKKYDGSFIWIRGSYNPIFDANGKPYKAVKFAQVIQKVE
jgi:PAS domain S-box-containing protein